MKIDYDFTTPFWEVSFLRPVIGNNEALDCPRKFKYEKRWNEGDQTFPSFRPYIDEMRVNYRFADGLYGGIFSGSISLRPDIETIQKFMTDPDSWWKWLTGIRFRFGYRGPSPNAATLPITAFATNPKGGLSLSPDIGFEFSYMGTGFRIGVEEGIVLKGTQTVEKFLSQIVDAFDLNADFSEETQSIMSQSIALKDEISWKRGSRLQDVLNAFFSKFTPDLDYTVMPGESDTDEKPWLKIFKRPDKKATSIPKPEVMFVWGRPINLQADPPVLPIEDFETETNWNFFTRAFAKLEASDDVNYLTKARMQATRRMRAKVLYDAFPARDQATLSKNDDAAQKFGDAGLVLKVAVTVPSIPLLPIGAAAGLMIGNNFIGGQNSPWQIWQVEHTLSKSGFKCKVHLHARPVWADALGG
jgi:hypothetical protein